MSETQRRRIPAVLTVAGSDCSGGAGIQADLKTMTAHQCYGMSVITALTAQNTMGVSGIAAVDQEFVQKQLEQIFQDIPPEAVKIGMIGQAETAITVAACLKRYGAKRVVLDPVLVSTSGSPLTVGDAERVLMQELFPLASVVTPNLPEAERLSGMEVKGENEMVQAAERLMKWDCGAVLIKGGHLNSGASDRVRDLLYLADGSVQWLTAPRVQTENTHGTGCTLSSAIACNLALGFSLEASAAWAKCYVTGALQANLHLGRGNGPLNHCWNL